jgi:hypothetical protein
VLSHHQAAALYDLRGAPSSRIHVTAPGRRAHVGIECHVARGMRGRPRVVVDGIPVVSVKRLFLDMAGVLGLQALRSRLEAAQRKNAFDHQRALYTIAASNGHQGIGPLHAALALLGDRPPAPAAAATCGCAGAAAAGR